MIKNCKHCGKPFDANTTWQEFCSDAHRVAYYRAQEKAKEQEKQPKNKKPGK